MIINPNLTKLLDWLEKQPYEEGDTILHGKLPSIPRSVWNQLPHIGRDILENNHGYNHYNPDTDDIESEESYIK